MDGPTSVHDCGYPTFAPDLNPELGCKYLFVNDLGRSGPKQRELEPAPFMAGSTRCPATRGFLVDESTSLRTFE
jgi:hypothetical protein